MRWRWRRNPPPPKPEPHPLLGEAYLSSEYNSWFYKLPLGADWGCHQLVWADKADEYADIIAQTLADNEKKRVARKKARDERARMRAEFTRLRDEMLTRAIGATDLDEKSAAAVGAASCATILDLIDKHTREGQ